MIAIVFGAHVAFTLTFILIAAGCIAAAGFHHHDRRTRP